MHKEIWETCFIIWDTWSLSPAERFSVLCVSFWSEAGPQ